MLNIQGNFNVCMHKDNYSQNAENCVWNETIDFGTPLPKYPQLLTTKNKQLNMHGLWRSGGRKD